MPKIVQEGEKAMQAGSLLEARDLFATYLRDHDEGVFAHSVKWVMASLPDPLDEPGNEFLKQIERLQAIRSEQPDSVYAPWALCSIGQIYWDAGWYSEASGLFEEFLGSYPNHPIAGGVMVEAGLGYLENQQFLEAALVLRRVVQEPKYEAYRLRGALGLADATAMSKAWRQAYYWYRVVEAERPDLLRKSFHSYYHYGLTELAVGNSQDAISHFLMTINLHPKKKISGKAFNRISEQLLKDKQEYLSLWFAEQVKERFKGQEAGRRGQAAQIRWVVNYLSQDHSKEEREQMYKRLVGLEIFLSVSWDNVVETARKLSQAPEQDLVEESLWWMGRGYLILQDIPAATQTLKHLIIVATSETLKNKAQQLLGTILNQQLQTFNDREAWVALLKFHEDQQDAFQLTPLTPERIKFVAQAYQHINLPAKAMEWFDQLLRDHPESVLREEIFAHKVFLAEEQGQKSLIREAGGKYVQEYPKGHWRAEVSAILGMDSVGREDYSRAIQELSDVLSNTNDTALERYVLRNRSMVYQKTGKRDKALQDLQKVVTLDPLDMANAVRLGDFLFDQGDYAEAEQLYDRVFASEAPEALKAWAKYRWGLSLEYQGNSPKAKKLLAEVRELETRSPEFENTIRAAAVAVLDEFSLKEKPTVGRNNEGS